MKFLRFAMIVAAFSLMTSAARAQSATPLFNWAGNSGNTELTTTVVSQGPNYNASKPGQNITELWFAQDASNYYFRLDLAGAATSLAAYGGNLDHAEAYAIDIAFPTGGRLPEEPTACLLTSLPARTAMTAATTGLTIS